jgi:predicted  nucleic acid-binding Zn-ribbon protein
MRRPEKDRKPAVEKWIDENIQVALAGLMQPFEKRIARLWERIQSLQNRVQRISDRLSEKVEPSPGAEKDPKGREE